MRAVAAGGFVILLAFLGVARADPGAPAAPGAVRAGRPIRVAIECEGQSRTKACPAFLLGFVDANKVLLSSPRASAEVVVYASTTIVALVDKTHLRFVGTIAGAPAELELDLDLDSRAADDAQRGQLQPAFLRGIALYVAARHPKAVTVSLAEIEAGAVVEPQTTPWGASLSFGGFGNYANAYQSYNGFSELEVSRLDRRSRISAITFANGGISRAPPVTVDGTEVSQDFERWNIGAGAKGAWLYNRSYALGAVTGLSIDDPKGQYAYVWNAKAGLEWDRYQADDPRGNRLAVLYFVGYQRERYHLRNIDGERFAHYPIHGAIASGSVRKDKISIGISFQIDSQMFDPARRYNISAAPFIEWKLGGHVDINLNFQARNRVFPEPDSSLVDPSDLAQINRLSYAEPFTVQGSFNLQIHWDRTNGARNDRFDDF